MPFAEREFIKKNTYIMTKEMLGYESPSTKVLFVRAGGIICGSRFGEQGAAGDSLDLDDESNNYGSF